MLQTFFETHGTVCEYKEGDVVVDCGRIPTHVFLLESGYVKASVLTPRGNEHVLIFYKPGEIFPARWAFTEIKGNAYYTAITPVVVHKVQKNAFKEFLLNNPSELLHAVEYTTKIMDVFVQRVNDMAHLTAYLKLIGRLLTLSRRFGKPESEGVLIEIPVTRSDLASSVAMTRETVSREMSKLEKKGLLEYKNQRLYIPNMTNLKDELNKCDFHDTA